MNHITPENHRKLQKIKENLQKNLENLGKQRKSKKNFRKTQTLENGRHVNAACPKMVCDFSRMPKLCEKSFLRARMRAEPDKNFRKTQTAYCT